MKKVSLLLILLGTAATGLWLGGFLGFVDTVISLQEPSIEAGLQPTDAIVVLTGGSERMATGLSLLTSGNGKKLLISGVHKKLSLEGLPKTPALPPELRACCIVLGYNANSTYGNAEETRDWIKSEGYASLRLVTANYHMPRSLLLFHAVLPNTTIVPHPISPESVRLDRWWLHPGTVTLLATEYCKYLVASLRIGTNEK